MKLTRTELELEVVVQRIERGEIDLQPEFQRGEVWNSERRRRLIDTVLRGWYVPAVHLIRHPDGYDLVLDGQQRLAAIRAFFLDRLRVNGKASPLSDEIVALDRKRFSKLPDRVRRDVQRFPLAVVTLSDYEPDEPYELFFRLNQHLPLTPSEKRNALYGTARDQIKEIVRELIDEDLLNKATVGFANGRLAYDDVLSRFALTVQSGTLRQGISNAALEEFYRNGTFDSETLSLIEMAARTLLASAQNAQPRFNKASLFSWLVFSLTELKAGRTIDPQALTIFERARHAVNREDAAGVDEPVAALIGLYINRASYRVNDNLSILLRDLTIRLTLEALGSASDSRFSFVLAEIQERPRLVERILAGFESSVDWDPLR